MKKRILSLLLTAFLVLPCAFVLWEGLAVPVDPYAHADSARKEAITEARGEFLFGKSTGSDFQKDCVGDRDRYIVKFLDSASKTEISKALEGYSHQLLAYSEHRLFAVSVEDMEQFLSKWGELVDYTEADRALTVTALYNDPVIYDQNGMMGLENAQRITAGDKSTVVAVLDTGIFREHEELKNASILSGYDAVSGSSGVSTDSSGHGTAVTGIIAATANNGQGAAGAANGVTVLPVKVASNRTTIYSSHLIAGIRFAADAGADVINMSVGGYSSSFAEQEAVNYALDMGCILVAASGNEGNRSNGGEKCYPASYEGVISVGSVNSAGEPSGFSQYNDMVDVCAPGENVHIIVWENGTSLYATDSGTSYSCAFVSAIAALSVSHCDIGVRLGANEFEALIASVCGSERDPRLGHGIINAEKILEKTNYPIVTGVFNGMLYTDKLTVGFNRGTAVLDGEPITDGESVIKSGTHTLTVSEGDRVTALVFRLDYDPLSYDFLQYTGFARFEFDRGTATLDGYPYFSGDRITAHGQHVFCLEYGDEKLTKTFYAATAVPTAYGVENGRVYDRAVNIRVLGDGAALLDGEETEKDFVVTQNGTHVLTLRSGWGGKTATVEFEIRAEGYEVYDTDYAHGFAYVDEENGFLLRYGETLVGARIYDTADLTAYSSLLLIGTVVGHGVVGDELLLFGDETVTVVDPALVKEGAAAVKRKLTLAGCSDFAVCGESVFCLTENLLCRVDTETGALITEAALPYRCDALISDGKTLCVLCGETESIVYVFEPENGFLPTEFLLSESFDGKPLMLKNGRLAVANRLYDLSDGSLISEFQSKFAVFASEDFLITDRFVLDARTGETAGVLPFEISWICEGTENRYIIGQYGELAVCRRDIDGVAAFGAAPAATALFSAPESYGDYRKNAFYDPNRGPVSLWSRDGNVYGLFQGENAVFLLDSSLETVATERLDFVPSSVTSSEGFVSVCFESVPFVWVAPESDLSAGKYIAVSVPYKKVFSLEQKLVALGDDGIVFIPVDGGEISETGTAASDIDVFEGRIYACNGSEVFVLDSAGESLLQAECNGETVICAEHTVAVGSTLLRRDTLEIIAETDSNILALSGFAAVTEKGIFDASDGSYVGTHGTELAQLCAVDGNGSVYAFENGNVCVSGFGNGFSPVTTPVVNGVENGQVYTGQANIEFDLGKGFVDGKEIHSGASVTENGKHRLHITLPFGRSVTVEFVVAAYIREIEIIGGDRNLSVGESIQLLIQFHPDGASSVPVRFFADSDGVTVSQSGEVTANRTGTYKITASAETEYGVFSDSCSVVVRDDLIRFRPESGIGVDRKNGFVTGVSAGISAGGLVGLLAGSSDAVLFDSDGMTPCSYVATGCVLVKYDSGGAECDRLVLVVTGDVDGNGFLTSADLYHTERVLKGYAYEQCFVFASDINGNGTADNGDFYELERILLGRNNVSVGEPARNEFGKAELQTLSVIRSGNVIDVAVCLRGCKNATGAVGLLKHSDGLVFKEMVSDGWSADVFSDGKNTVTFYSYDDDGGILGRGFGILAVLRFEVVSPPDSKLTFEVPQLTVDFADGTKTVEGAVLSTTVSKKATGDFCIFVSNAESFDFDPAVTEYDINIYFNYALADISTVCPQGWEVSFGCTMVPFDGGSAVIYVRAVDDAGNAKSYTLRVRRLPAPGVDNNCRLSVLEVEGFKLVPKFDPDVLEYTITVPYNVTEIKPYCIPQSDQASVHISSTLITEENTVVRITVFSPDGDKLIYLLNVVREPYVVPSEPSQSDPDGDHSGSKPWIVFAVLTAVAGTIGFLFLKNKKAASEHIEPLQEQEAQAAEEEKNGSAESESDIGDGGSSADGEEK